MTDEDREALDTVCTELGYYLSDLEWDDRADAEAGIRAVLLAAQPLFARLMAREETAS